MKTINLRKLYPPHYSKNVLVEVSDEVAEALLLMQREENNRRRKQSLLFPRLRGRH